MTEDDSSSSHEMALSSTSTPGTSSTAANMGPMKQESAFNHSQSNWAKKTGQERSGNTNSAHLQDGSDTELKIQLAVLKNELAHKERETQETVTACLILAKIVGSGYSRELRSAKIWDFGGIEQKHPLQELRILEEENQTLQRENEVLRKAIDISHRARSSPSSLESDDRKRSDNKMEEEIVRHNGETTSDKSGLSSTVKDSAECESPNIIDEDTKAWGNFPDVGIACLDDVIGPDEDAMPSPKKPAPVLIDASAKSQPSHEISRINEEANQLMECMTPVQNPPAPTVLKTGFALNGSFKGGDYNSIPQGPKAFNRMHSGNTSFSSSFGSTSSFERPSSSGDNAASFSSERGREPRPRRRYERPDSFDDFGASAGFFRYGVQYTPSEEDSNYMRRIMISNLPKYIHLKDVLAQVRGGVIVNATLLNTQKITGGMTVAIQFLHESSARNYLAFTKTDPIQFGSCGQKAEVELVKTPTWPLTTGLYPLILSQGQTRCLTIPSFPKEFSVGALEKHVTGKDPSRLSTLVNTTIDEDGALHLEFSGMAEAHFAYGILTHWQVYSELRPVFSPDPCAHNIDDLASIPPCGRMTPEKSRELAEMTPISEANAFSGASEVSEPKLPPESGSYSQQEAPPAVHILDVYVEPQFLHSSWADEVTEEEETRRLSLTEPVVGLDASIYGPAASPIPSDLTINESTESIIVTGAEKEGGMPLATRILSSQSDAVSSSERTTCTPAKSKNSPEEIIIKAPLPDLLPPEPSVASSNVLEEPKEECPQTPPRIRLESILEDSPAYPIVSNQDTGHDEQGSLPVRLEFDENIKLDLCMTPSRIRRP